jgi:hypothetical protein
MTNATNIGEVFAALEDANALIDTFLPEVVSLLQRPKVIIDSEWEALMGRLDTHFAKYGMDADVSSVALELLVAFAVRDLTREDAAHA